MPFCQTFLKANRPLPPWYPNQLQTVGDHIRRKRKEVGLHQKELAAILGVDKTTISNWERNLTMPAIQYGPGIVGFLGYVPPAVRGGLPQRIRRYRWVHGFTQKALAGLVGVDELAIRIWESGRGRPNARNQRRIQVLLASLVE